MSGPKLGISLRSKSRDANDFLKRVEEVSKFKPFSIELMGFAQDLIINGKIVKQRVEKIKNILNDFSGEISFHGPMVVNFLDKKENLNHYENLCKAYIDLAHRLRVKKLINHTGYCDIDDNLGLDRKYSLQRDYLKRIGDYAAKKNQFIYVENIFPFSEKLHTALPSKLADEIKMIDHENIKVCFDVSHAYLCCSAFKSDFISNAIDLGENSDHWHVHDSFGKLNFINAHLTKSEALALGDGDLHLPVGEGDIPWEELVSKTKLKSNVVFNIELNPEFWQDLETCVTNTVKLIEFSKNI